MRQILTASLSRISRPSPASFGQSVPMTVLKSVSTFPRMTTSSSGQQSTTSWTRAAVVGNPACKAQSRLGDDELLRFRHDQNKTNHDAIMGRGQRGGTSCRTETGFPVQPLSPLVEQERHRTSRD